MTLPSKRLLLLLTLASLLGGVALAAYELNNLHRGMSVAREIGAAVAKGLGGAMSEETMTVSVSLCFGLVPVGTVENPYLVIAVGDLILGTLVTAIAIALAYTLLAAFRRNHPVGTSEGETRNS
jgi:hypothetical protein